MTKDGAALPAEGGALVAPPRKLLSLDGSRSSDPDGGELTYAWTLGDGSSGANETEEHAYQVGEYLVTLIVTDEDGETGTATVTIKVPAPAGTPTVFFTDNADAPKAWTFTTFQGVPFVDCAMMSPRVITAAAWHTTSAQAHAGTRSWTHQNEQIGFYGGCDIESMVSMPVDLSAATEASVSLWFKGDSEEGFDLLFVEGSADKTTWTELAKKSGVVAGWTEVKVYLDDFLGGTFHLRLRFASDEFCSGLDGPTCGTQSFDGWFVDDITVAGLA